MIDRKKLIKGLVISALVIVIIISAVLIMINQGIIADEAYNHCTAKVYEHITTAILEECLRNESLKRAPILIPQIVLIVISSVIIIELTARHLTRKEIKNKLSEIKEENELMASPFTAALTTRHLLGIPFHVWDLGFCVGFIIGSIVGSGWLSWLCILMSVWCGIGAVIDYKKFKKLWR